MPSSRYWFLKPLKNQGWEILGDSRLRLFGLLELWFAIWILHADQPCHWWHVVVSVYFKPALHHCG